VTELEKWQDIGKELTSLLRLRTFPLAIKMVKSPDEFPEKARFPTKTTGEKALVCQAISQARIYGWTVALTPEECVICPGPVIFGWMELTDEKELASYWVEHLPFFENVPAALNFFSKVPRLNKGDYRGMVISPLEWTSIVPNLVMVHCNPAQIMRLIHACIYKEGEAPTGVQGAIIGTCQAIVDPVVSGQPKAVLPGVGDRVAGGLQDDEVIFSAPADRMDEIMDGLRVAPRSRGIRYPIPYSYLRVAGLVPYREIEDKFKLVEP